MSILGAPETLPGHEFTQSESAPVAATRFLAK
jgi:hypothetical protein